MRCATSTTFSGPSDMMRRAKPVFDDTANARASERVP